MSSVCYHDLGGEHPVAVRAEGMYPFGDSDEQYLESSGRAAVSALCYGHEASMDARLIGYPGVRSVDGKGDAHIELAPPVIVDSKCLDELATKLETNFREVFKS